MIQKTASHPLDFYLSITTPGVLGILVMIVALEEIVISIGLASEEVFWGDRLPLLKKPDLFSSS